MLMTNIPSTTIPIAPDTVPDIQLGPVYHCWRCGQVASRPLVIWTTHSLNPCPLDDWANHIAYLPCPCAPNGAVRVAKLGRAIMRLEFADTAADYPSLWAHNVQAVRKALKQIAAVIPAEQYADDPLANFVYAIALGYTAPDKAVRQLRNAINGPLSLPLIDNALSASDLVE